VSQDTGKRIFVGSTRLEGGQCVISLSDSAVTEMCQIVAVIAMAESRIDEAQND
jgi:hypothetical protein